jgi:hypothetical protein
MAGFSRRSASKGGPAIGTANWILTAISGVDGRHLLDLIPSHCRFNTQYFVEYGMAPLVQTVFPQGRTWCAHRLNDHLNNCRIHFSKATEQFFIENQLLHALHPPSRPDLPCRTSGYSGVSTLDSLAEGSPNPKNCSIRFHEL